MIRYKLLSAFLMLAISASPALAEIQFAIGEPTPDTIRSGIGQISGWAVSDVPIVSVEAFMDGASLGLVPYGGTRMDVAAAFPDKPDSEYSGWAMKWNYSLLEPGEHIVTIVVTDAEGGQLIKDVVFSTIGFKSEFIADPAKVRTAGAAVSTPEDGRIVITGIEVDGESVDIELLWDTATQQFLINKIHSDAVQTTNQAPTVNAGPNLTVETGSPVEITASASDSDGTISAWDWTQVSGLQVTLQNEHAKSVFFTAPGSAGNVRLRITVTDDDGATAYDNVTITVEAPAPPPNQAPTANAGANQTVQQGDPVTLSGSGSDSDGTIVSWSWQHVSGPAVSLSNAGSQVASFTAPNSAGEIRIRLTVTDDDGAFDTDDVIITVEEAAEPDNTTGSLLQSMLPVLNDARGTEQNCGGTIYPPQPPFEWSSSLADIARQHSMDMARQGYFAHESFDGTSMGDRVWPYWAGQGNYIGENIAASSGNLTDAQVVNMWLDSPGHCKLIMEPDFTHVGIGTGQDSDNGYKYHYFWTLDFGGTTSN